MVLALAARQHFLDVVEAPDQARPKVEPCGSKLGGRLGLAECVQSGPQDVVHDRLERHATFPSFPLQSHRHVVVECEGRPHILMLCI